VILSWNQALFPPDITYPAPVPLLQTSLICTEVIMKIRSTRLEPKLPTRSLMFSCNSPPTPLPLLTVFLLSFYLSGVTRSTSEDGGCDPANEKWSALLCFLARLQSHDFNYWILVTSCPQPAKWRRQKDLLLSCQCIKFAISWVYVFSPFLFLFAVALRPNAGHGLLILEVF